MKILLPPPDANLLPLDAYPLAQHPAAVYLARLTSANSRRTMRAALYGSMEIEPLSVPPILRLKLCCVISTQTVQNRNR